MKIEMLLTSYHENESDDEAGSGIIGAGEGENVGECQATKEDAVESACDSGMRK